MLRILNQHFNIRPNIGRSVSGGIGRSAEIAEPGFPAKTRDKRPPKAAADLTEGVRRPRSGRLKYRVGKQSEIPTSSPPAEPWSGVPYTPE